MIDIKLIRDNPELVKENIKKKFQESKLALVDEVLELDKKNRAAITEVEALRAKRTNLSKQICALMGQGKKDEAEAIKKESQDIGQRILDLEAEHTIDVRLFKSKSRNCPYDGMMCKGKVVGIY